MKTLLTIILVLATTAASAATVEKIVATVNGEAITSYDLDMAVKKDGPGIGKKYHLSGNSLRAKVLDKLIGDKLLEIELNRATDDPNMKVEPHEVDAYIDRILRNSRITLKMFEDELIKEGYTLDKYKAELHEQILQNKFISSKVGRKVDISERELKAYFDRHMDDFKSPSSVQLNQISIPFTQTTTPENLKSIEKVAVMISKEGKNTSDFEALAKKFSGKPFMVQGGSLGVINLADLQPSIAQVAAQLEIGQVSSPIVTQTGVHIIKITARAKTSAKDFASVREQVHDVLYSIKMKSAMQNYVRELRRKAFIEIRSLGSN